MPKITATPELICPGFFVDVATWSGVPIQFVMDKAGIQPDAQKIILVSVDGYENSFSLQEALVEENFFAYE